MGDNTLTEKDTQRLPEEPIYGQICQDPVLTKKFRDFHVEMVNKVISFCVENHVLIDDFNLHADGLLESLPHGCWQPCTDSGFEMYRREDIERGDPETYLFSM